MTLHAPRNAARILVVDDDPIALRLFERFATGFGHSVETAADARDVIHRTLIRQYDIIVTDVMMPSINGIELIDRVHRRHPTVVFVLVTGAVDLTQFRAQSGEARIARVISKPLERDKVQEAIALAVSMSGRPQLTPPESNRVLIVEDSASDALLLRRALGESAGTTIEHVTRLSEAIQRLHDDSFDTIITDLSLPDSRGLDAVARLRVCAGEATLIVCSGVADETLELEVLELGAHDFLGKDRLDAATVARSVRFARVRRASERRLARLAYHDALTGLPNRALFNERLEQALAQARRKAASVGVMFLDLNGFKVINDTYGHEAGDLVLCEFADRLRAMVRECDVVTRLGGDEFAVLAPFADREQLEVLSRRITAQACAPVTVRGVELEVRASVGLAVFPESGSAARDLLRVADAEMYDAKRALQRSGAVSVRTPLASDAAQR